MSDSDDNVPSGVCTAPKCKCSCFKPQADRIMRCGQPKCGHSVEWHHMSAKEIR